MVGPACWRAPLERSSFCSWGAEEGAYVSLLIVAIYCRHVLSFHGRHLLTVIVCRHVLSFHCHCVISSFSPFTHFQCFAFVMVFVLGARQPRPHGLGR